MKPLRRALFILAAGMVGSIAGDSAIALDV